MGVKIIPGLPAGVVKGGRRSKYADLIEAIETNQEALLAGKEIQYSVPNLHAKDLNNRLNSYLKYQRANMNLPDNVKIVKSIGDHVYISLEYTDKEV